MRWSLCRVGEKGLTKGWRLLSMATGLLTCTWACDSPCLCLGPFPYVLHAPAVPLLCPSCLELLMMYSLGCPFQCHSQPLMKQACVPGSSQCLLKSGLLCTCFSLLPSIRPSSMEEGGYRGKPQRGREGKQVDE